jgi:hypothetical protein
VMPTAITLTLQVSGGMAMVMAMAIAGDVGKNMTRTRTTMICPRRARQPKCPRGQPFTSVGVQMHRRQK